MRPIADPVIDVYQDRRRTRQSGGLALLGAARADTAEWRSEHRFAHRYLRQREVRIRAATGGR